MKEIEVKAYLENKEVVMQKLTDLGCVFSDAITQTDTVFAKVVTPYEAYLQNDHFVRIREKNDGTFVFTVKMQMGKELTKTEYETTVANGEQMNLVILAMGYKVANKLKKTRQMAHYKDFEICIDDIEGLGEFIEIEKMSSENEDAVRAELYDFMLSLGIAKDDETKKGYDMLVMEKIQN